MVPTSWGSVPPTLRSVSAKGQERVKWLNHYNLATDCPIWLKFGMMMQLKIPEGRLATTLEPEVEFHRKGGVLLNSVLGVYLRR